MDSSVLFKRKVDGATKRKCMNCGKTLAGDLNKDLYARRFCSIKCKSDYFGENMDLKDV